jgi:hypothetical protein
MIRARLGGAVAKAALPVLSILVCVGACAATSSAEPPGRQARASAPANAAPFAASPSSSAHVPVSAPATAPASGRLRVAVISDLNGSYGSTTYGPEVHGAVASVVGQVRPDVVLVTGDMVAGMRANLRYGAMWSGFHAAVSEPLAAAGIPLAPAPGNHDASGYPVYAAERGEYARQWSQPGRVPALRFVDREHYPLRYSFTLGPAFFIALDATTVGPVSVEQRAWVDRQLAATTLPVKIAYGHLPLHPIAHGRVAEVLNDRELEEVFTRRGLTAYVSGHHHAYYPGAAGGFLQIAMPCLGGGARPVVGTTGASPRALVVIDVEDGRVTAVDALQAPSFVTAIDRTRLPQRISHRKHLLVRDDVAGLLPRPGTNVARSGATAPTAHPASLAAPLR